MVGSDDKPTSSKAGGADRPLNPARSGTTRAGFARTVPEGGIAGPTRPGASIQERAPAEDVEAVRPAGIAVEPGVADHVAVQAVDADRRVEPEEGPGDRDHRIRTVDLGHLGGERAAHV